MSPANESPDLRVGVDVGGTNTDAVVIDTAGEVLAAVKVATTPEPIDGIRAALDEVLVGIEHSRISKAMLGTTHSANAIIQRRGLDRVAVLRLAAPSSLGVRPGAAWPEDIRARVVGTTSIIKGGHEYNGREIAPLDTEAVKRLAGDAVRTECRSVAVAAAFSPATSEHGIRARDILHAELGADFPVSLSHEIGSLGLLERENATILNAALLSVATRVISGFEEALAERHLAVDAYLTQNDGTLMMAAEASQYPVLTLGSGPTNSMRGACALAGVNDAIVIDVGGTSADAGILVGGFPRQSSAAVEVGGVRTNFRMPDLISMGLGGGTIVRDAGADLRIGPDSVGYAVAIDAICVGGDVLTLSDISMAAGRMTGFGDPDRVRSLDAGLVEDALGWVDEQISAMSDRMKSTRAALPLLAVGGGAHLIPDAIPGVSEVIRPKHQSVANAYGAGIAKASGSVDRVYSYDASSRDDCLADARDLAANAAVRAGADPDRVRITTVTEVPMTYVPGGGCRVMVKAAGPLAQAHAGRGFRPCDVCSSPGRFAGSRSRGLPQRPAAGLPAPARARRRRPVRRRLASRIASRSGGFPGSADLHRGAIHRRGRVASHPRGPRTGAGNRCAALPRRRHRGDRRRCRPRRWRRADRSAPRARGSGADRLVAVRAGHHVAPVGVRMASLTWNRRTMLADGVGDTDTGGWLTSLGVEAVREMEHLGMVVDVSHLSAHGLAHLADVASAPFVASHSSCRVLCDHPRNLTDEQMKLVSGSGGFVAINAFGRFVAAAGTPRIDRFVDHVEHAATVIGDAAVAIGADFIADLVEQVDPILGRQLLVRLEDLVHIEEFKAPADFALLSRKLVERFGRERAGRFAGSNMLDFFRARLPV